MGIDDDIATIDQQIDKLTREVELLRAERKGLTAAKRYLPGGAPAIIAAEKARSLAETGTKERRGGRQPGAISHHWQDILRHLYGVTFDVAYAAQVVMNTNGKIIRAGELKRQLETYLAQGYVSRGIMAGHYQVTDAAAEKFGFSSPKTTEDRSTRSSDASGGGLDRALGYPPVSPGGSNPPTSTSDPVSDSIQALIDAEIRRRG